MVDKKLSSAVDAHLDSSGSLYQKEVKIYPRSVTGSFASLRKWSMYVLLGLFYGVLWLRWNGQQAVLFDLPARKFHLFGLTLWPQDFIYLAIILVISALSLFFVTALAGRVWCGFACPQTVWTEAFMLIERWTEGDRFKRIKLDRGPWNKNKVIRKSSKQILWITFALWTGFTFVGYFTPVHELAAKVVSLSLGPWEWFWILFYGFATYGNAGFLREQVCKYMCPYARFQSAMFDRDTMIISYDKERGEPRGSRRRGADAAETGLGSCIDCTLCVQVCPTGIDIREGLQYECIACAACIDVCDQVMTKMEYPTGLIRYTTENKLQHKDSRIIRPRVIVYSLLLLTLCCGLIYSVFNRTPLRLEVIRDRNALYRELGDDMIENVYTLRVINMTNQEQQYKIDVDSQQDVALDTQAVVVVAAESSDAKTIRLRAPKSAGAGVLPITIRLTDTNQPGVQIERQSRFFLPIE